MKSAAQATRAWAEARAHPCTYYDEVGSTNDVAKGAGEGLFLTAHQTAGRGRGDHRWLDGGSGQILLSSWAFLLSEAPRAITGPRVGLALHRALRQAWPHIAWALKAPNDLFVGRSKLAGLLIEVISTGPRHQLIVGLGLNVLSHPLATSTDLNETLGQPTLDREWFQFLDAWARELRDATRECTHAELTPDVRAELRAALNLNQARAFDVSDVTPAGDLIHAGGVVRWTEL